MFLKASGLHLGNGEKWEGLRQRLSHFPTDASLKVKGEWLNDISSGIFTYLSNSKKGHFREIHRNFQNHKYEPFIKVSEHDIKSKWREVSVSQFKDWLKGLV